MVEEELTNVAGKNVLITGAASGIGRRLAEQLAAQAAHVILWDIDDVQLRALADELSGKGARVTSYHCDVAQRQAVYDTAERVGERSGPVDILINNAGIVSGKPLLEATDEQIVRTFEVNALALFWTARAFLPAMIGRDGGHIVTVASAAGLVGTPRLSDYCASKFAAVGFDEALRLELRRQRLNIRTTVVCPFFVNTGMFQGVQTRFPWLLPILEPEYVAARIIDAIKRNRRRLIMPRFAYVAPPLRALPTPAFDALLDFFGISRAMDEFSGRGAGGGAREGGRG